MNKKNNPAYILAKQRSKKKSKFSKRMVLNAASMLGRSGGLIGGDARAAALSQKERTEIAIHAANMRWNNPCNCTYCKGYA